MEFLQGRKVIVLVLLIWTALSSSQVSSEDTFDVREHLSTATRYDYGRVSTEKLVNMLVNQNVELPQTCSPIHLNIVARHGTRAPTKKRIKQINAFAERIQELGNSSVVAPEWMRVWKSPWQGRIVGGEVLEKGEEEMYELGERIHTEFPEIFKEAYHPDFYMISATQVPRSAASAVAFGMGLFAGKGTLGPGHHRAFAVISDSRTHDTHLRFYEGCGAYQDSKAKGIPLVATLQEDSHIQIALSLKKRFSFNITKDDIPTLWFLCKQEAAALDIVDRSCSLFTKEEVELLEWADDVEVHRLKGYGESINYRMGVPLLGNVLSSMEQAIAERKEGHVIGRAHLRFAHAETIIPFICLLGLFLDAGDVNKILMEAPLEPPPPPPQARLWKGSAVAPYGANSMVVLYDCSDGSKKGTKEEDYMVQILHNEKSMALPGCNGTHLCPYQVFKDQVILPHLKYTYESLCSVQAVQGYHDEL